MEGRGMGRRGTVEKEIKPSVRYSWTTDGQGLDQSGNISLIFFPEFLPHQSQVQEA